MSIFKQLVLLSKFYSKQGFFHGEPCYSYIYFDINEIKFTYKDIDVDSSLVLSISPSTKSEIIYSNKLITTRSNVYFTEACEMENRDIFLIGNRKDKFMNVIESLSALILSCSFHLNLIKPFIIFIDITLIKNSCKLIWGVHESVIQELLKCNCRNFKSVFEVISKYPVYKQCLKEVIKNLKIYDN